MSGVLRIAWAATLLAAAAAARAAGDDSSAGQVIDIPGIGQAPIVDGDLAEWGGEGWRTVEIHPAVENDDKNRVGFARVELRMAVSGDWLYMAVRWPDASADTAYRQWRWSGSRYRRGREADDMFAVRFHLSGEYDKCMIADRDYRVDTWLWSAGRSNLSGYADDLSQIISTRLLEDAAEHPGPDGRTVYIRKVRDAGAPVYRNTRPQRQEFKGDRLPGAEPGDAPSGSAADVTARGVWRDGYWNLELARRLDTGNGDDVVFAPGKEVIGAIGVFNRAKDEHKSVSGTLRFRFPSR